VPGIRIRKRLTVPRRSTPPADEPPKTWTQIIFFPLSWIALASMAVMLLIYLWLTSLVEPADEAHEDYLQPPAIPLATPVEFPSPVPSLPLEPPPPSGGIVIEK
jgi:hypothetical protein